MAWLLERKLLTLKEQEPERFFNAFLWGADMSAAIDATLIFYSVDRDADGQITDISFNFVAKSAFDTCYTLV